MRLMVPASTLSDAKALIEAGAEDIYVGATSDAFNNYSFNGRSVVAKNGKRVLPDFYELEKMCSLVHKKGGKVYFLANNPMLNGDSCDLKEKFLNYVDEGVNAGADYVILGNINTLMWVTNKYPNIKTVASSYLEAQNEYTIKLLESFGVSQIVLSYQCNLNEIKELCNISHAQIEVFGHGGCSFYVGSCNMFHEMGESINIGYPCRATYDIKHEGINMQTRILDCFKMCSLCKLKELEKCGVHSLKIVGRDLPSDYILSIVKVYSAAIEQLRGTGKLNMETLDIPKWWTRTWCLSDSNLCRYGGQYFECDNCK